MSLEAIKSRLFSRALGPFRAAQGSRPAGAKPSKSEPSRAGRPELRRGAIKLRPARANYYFYYYYWPLIQFNTPGRRAAHSYGFTAASPGDRLRSGRDRFVDPIPLRIETELRAGIIYQ